MNAKSIPVFILLLLVSNILAQPYRVPESAAFHAPSKSYFISNWGNGDINRIDSTGKKTVFNKSMAKALGILIDGDVLYVVENPQNVKGFDINTGKTVLDVHIDGAEFLNDITQKDSTLYVTDSRKNKIWQVDINSQTSKLYINTTTTDPNGILYDSTHERLIVCHFKANAPITAVSLKDKSITTLVDSVYFNLDGLTMDTDGNIYVSSWGPGSFETGFQKGGTIYRFDPEFDNKPKKILTHVPGPADIYYNPAKNELVVPLFLANTVHFEPMSK